VSRKGVRATSNTLLPHSQAAAMPHLQASMMPTVAIITWRKAARSSTDTNLQLNLRCDYL
jgi:hypothetical protein